MKLQALLVLCGFLGMPFVGAQTILLPGAPENTERKAAEELGINIKSDDAYQEKT